MRDAEKILAELMALFLIDEIRMQRVNEGVSEKIMVDMEEIHKAEKMYD